MNNIIKQIEKTVVKETSVTFSKSVIDRVWEKDMGYFDALNEVMVEKNYEPEYCAKLITPELKSFLTEELEKLSLVKKSGDERLDF